MKVTTLDDTNTSLYIGIYMICIIDSNENDELYMLPDCTVPFQSRNPLQKVCKKINYRINLERSFSEPADRPFHAFNNGPIPYRIYQTNLNEYLWIRNYRFSDKELAFKISGDWSTWTLIADNSNSMGMDSFEELAYIFPYSILNKDGILFHGVVMEWQGMGIIFCAHSGVGKTTHTRMWKDNENGNILNGDRALCCKAGGEWFTYGAPWCGSSGEYQNKGMKLDVVVLLEQSDENEVQVLRPVQGAKELIRLTFAPSWEESLMNLAFDSINDIVMKVPVLKLRCRPDYEAVAVLKDKLNTIKTDEVRY
ncbi:MAG TPA: hypothetical protein VN131_02835 [Mobilitalea sp.]|nr:hypothetical protein [Mobilitalea sp.]